VVSTESKEYAREQIQKSRFDVLIFGNTLPRDTCWELAEVFRKHNAAGKIIEIIAAPWLAPKNQPDATVVSTDAPDNLTPKMIRPSIPALCSWSPRKEEVLSCDMRQPVTLKSNAKSAPESSLGPGLVKSVVAGVLYGTTTRCN